MNIRDEIDAMLDNLKTGGTKPPQPSVKAAPKNTNPPAPKTVKQPKTIYDDMSVDELLNSLTVQAKAKSEEAALRLSESKAEAKKTPIEDYAEKLVAAPAPSLNSDHTAKKESEAAQNNRRSAVASIKAAMEQADEPSVTEYKPAVSEVVQTESASVTADMTEEYAEPSFDSYEDEIAEDIIENYDSENSAADNDYSEKSDAEDEYSYEDNSEETEEITSDEQKPAKKGLFSGIKSLFSKKAAPEKETVEAAEESADDDENEEISKEFTAQTNYPAEETDETVLSEEELLEQLDEELPEEDSDDIPESSDEPVQDISEEDITEAETALPESDDNSAPEDTQESASELIDAAIAAIEELNLDSENADESYTETESEAAALSDDDAADELISDIREDAAEVIAEITGDKSDEKADEEKTAEETAEETADSGSENDVDIDINVETPKKKSRIIAALENILEENPDVISDERSEKTEADSIDISLEKKSSGKLKKYLYTICGVFFAVFTVVGIIASVSFISSRFRSFTAGENKKDSFTHIIYPAVIMDIESFASPSELSSEQIISASLWSLIMSEEKMSKYQQTFDIISVPAVDVEAYATELFGKTLPEIDHSTVGSGELKFYYNSETKSYNVPVNPISFTYEPVITSVSKTDNKYTLVVDYIKELPAWIEDKEGYTPDVSKTAEFILTEKDGAYTISSMTLLNVNGAL